ncbi:MAG: hypothetical protein Q7U47_13010 [Paludibacter sp.]|nr:hypothetical protein [Paludibacter sp.]
MKKIIVTLALLVSIACAMNAQVDGKAIGLRFGYGAELSYQHPLGNANRLELDLGLSNWGIALNGIYQWVWDLSALSDGFNWYAGAGAAVGFHQNFFGVGILGQVGIEYNFNIPLQLSLDYRPGIYVLPGFHSSYDGICLGVRYRF